MVQANLRLGKSHFWDRKTWRVRSESYSYTLREFYFLIIVSRQLLIRHENLNVIYRTRIMDICTDVLFFFSLTTDLVVFRTLVVFRPNRFNECIPLSFCANILSVKKYKRYWSHSLYIYAIIVSFKELYEIINHIVAFVSNKLVFFGAIATLFCSLPGVFNKGTVRVRASWLINCNNVNDRFLTPVEHKIISHHVAISLFVISHMSYRSDKECN